MICILMDHFVIFTPFSILLSSHLYFHFPSIELLRTNLWLYSIKLSILKPPKNIFGSVSSNAKINSIHWLEIAVPCLEQKTNSKYNPSMLPSRQKFILFGMTNSISTKIICFSKTQVKQFKMYFTS